MKQKGILYTSASAILFGIAPLLTVIVYREDVSSMTTVFYRALFAVIMLAALQVQTHFLCAFQAAAFGYCHCGPFGKRSHNDPVIYVL